ncbi:metallophosphoesterase family protein [Brevundimonas kwangchunensis]|uniref:Metallophosphoesterase family protein n=1 Tax=Brevundimonas kwangchunensis TaxID=322163 RepID=A0ABP3RIW5_9CAUL
MISTLFKRKPKAPVSPVVPQLPDGIVVWAVGDIHGCLDLLKGLVDQIMVDAAATTAERKVVIFLGDYIDRGPDSRGVLEYLLKLPRDIGIEWRFLKGNHEEAMLKFLDDPSFGPNWCEYGGDAALASYGLKPPEIRHRVEAWARVSADLDHKVTTAERDFLNSLEYSVSIGDYFFAHAGARPGVALDRQSERDLMWIRGRFLDDETPFEKVVVHGHTPTTSVYSDHRRIGVDTKAYASGELSAISLSGCRRTVLTARFAPTEAEALRSVVVMRHEEKGLV